MILGVVATYFLAHSLSKESFGEYHFILNFIGILSIFALPGLCDSVMQSVARGGFSGTYRYAVILAFICSFLGTLILAGLGWWYLAEGSNNLATGFFIAAAIFPFMHGLIQWKAVKTGEENFLAFLKLEGSSAFVMYFLMISAILLFPGSFLLPLAVLCAVPALLNLVMTIHKLRRTPCGNKQEIEPGAIAYGLKTTFYGAFNIIAKHVDKLLLFFFLSPASLALFVAADRLAELVRNATQDIAVVLGPRFAKHSHYSKRVDNVLKLFSLIIGGGIILFSFTLLPWVVTLIFGSDYEQAIPYAQALMCSVAIGNLGTLRFRFIRSRLDSTSFRNVTIITSLVRISFSLFLIPLWGLTGAVISVFIYRIAMTITVGLVMKYRYPVEKSLP